MTKDNEIELRKPAIFVDDSVIEILRNSARKLLAEAFQNVKSNPG